LLKNKECGCSSRVELRIYTNKLPLIITKDICIIECICHLGLIKPWGPNKSTEGIKVFNFHFQAALFSSVGKQTPISARFSTVGGESGSADTARDPRGFAVKFYTEEGNWDLVKAVLHTE
jgi:hypothetical protein